VYRKDNKYHFGTAVAIFNTWPLTLGRSRSLKPPLNSRIVEVCS